MKLEKRVNIFGREINTQIFNSRIAGISIYSSPKDGKKGVYNSLRIWSSPYPPDNQSRYIETPTAESDRIVDTIRDYFSKMFSSPVLFSIRMVEKLNKPFYVKDIIYDESQNGIIIPIRYSIEIDGHIVVLDALKQGGSTFQSCIFLIIFVVNPHIRSSQRIDSYVFPLESFETVMA